MLRALIQRREPTKMEVALEVSEMVVLVEELEEAPLIAEQAEAPAIMAELLIEEVSIDGMCGVY